MAKDSKKNKHFFKDFKAELKRVIWPTPKQLVKNTIAVVVIVILTVALVFILDFMFKLLNTSANKLKSTIKTSIITEVNSTELNNVENLESAE